MIKTWISVSASELEKRECIEDYEKSIKSNQFLKSMNENNTSFSLSRALEVSEHYEMYVTFLTNIECIDISEAVKNSGIVDKDCEVYKHGNELFIYNKSETTKLVLKNYKNLEDEVFKSYKKLNDSGQHVLRAI